MWINLEYLEHNQFLLNLPFVYRFLIIIQYTKLIWDLQGFYEKLSNFLIIFSLRPDCLIPSDSIGTWINLSPQNLEVISISSKII